jgi:hypothetical protein
MSPFPSPSSRTSARSRLPNRSIALAVALSACLSAPAHAQSETDRSAVRAAVLDYVDGFYEGDTARLVRSVRPEVTKYGFFVPRDKSAYEGEAMPWAEFLSYAKSVKARNTPPNPKWPKQIDLLDIADQTASAKVTAWWGIDYLHLAKYDGRWMIVHVLWQSPPKR